MRFGDALESAGPHANNVTMLQTDDHTNTSSLIFKGRMLFLTPKQQCQSTEGNNNVLYKFTLHYAALQLLSQDTKMWYNSECIK